MKETILNKMEREITFARKNEHEQETFLKHMNHIKLLSELFLEEAKEAPSNRSTSTFSEQEMKAMLGKTSRRISEEKQSTSTSINHDGANGSSIFDF